MQTHFFFFMFSVKLTGFSSFFGIPWISTTKILPHKPWFKGWWGKKKSNFPSGVYSSSASKQTATEKLFFCPYNSSGKVFARKAYKKSSVKQISIGLIHRAVQWKFSSAGSAIRSPQYRFQTQVHIFKLRCQKSAHTKGRALNPQCLT